MSEMSEAVKRQLDHADKSHQVDRRGWSDEQWVEDARQLMNDIDGSVLDLVNGHVLRLLDAARRFASLSSPETIEKGAEVLSQWFADDETWDFEDMRQAVEAVLRSVTDTSVSAHAVAEGKT